ncbi:MAG: MBL fold metallo-hydrolase [Lachnospiraceae bacterium]|nr:MBL fold metallo-hydrolase [Lachnospiraceae bacterium]
MTNRLIRTVMMTACVLLTPVLVACAGNSTDLAMPQNNQEVHAVESAETADMPGSDASVIEAAEDEDDDIEPEPPEKIMEVHFIDVGQADATLIKADGHAMLIDAGTDEVGTKVQYYLKQHDVSKLDYLILTHPDSDHIGGADVIITKFDIDTVFMSPFTKDNNWYEDLINALDYRNYKWSTPEVGSTYDLGEALFTVVAPNRVYSDPNNSSIALVLQYGDTRFLFTGDASEEAEADIVQNGLDISADVYKVGHHGSRSASTEDFLEKIDPKYAVISCSNGNEYGHPHEEAMDRLRKYNPEIFRTDEQGTIIAYSDGKEITWDHDPSTTWACGVQTQEEIPVIYNDIMKPEPDGDQIMKLEPDEGSNDTEGVVERGPAPDITYVLNINSMKFHYPDCSSVTDMKPKNRQDVDWTRDECIQAGYEPCGSCKP